MNQIIHHLKNSNNLFLATHRNPDGDAIGSLIAMGLSLEALNKRTTLYNESPIPAVYRFLPFADRIVQYVDKANIYDTAIILDCSDLERIGKAVSMVNKIPIVINIDHHITNTCYGDFQLIKSSACATTEIVHKLMKDMAVPINKAIAASIYTGILTDTGSFRFSNTNRAAFEICEEMVELGVDPYSIAQHVYGTYSLGRIKLLNMALDSIEISYNGRLSMMTLTRDMFYETDTRTEDADGLINYAKSVEDVKVAVLIQELQNKNKQFHVSLRSNGTVNVAEIASSFGGGGHFNAAGFSIESTLSDLKSQIFKLADKM
jgi:phosphoesterase RecJ-like protein